MKKIAFAGSFDIVTKGHLWVVQEGLNIADTVVMMLAHNSQKSAYLTEAEKVFTVKESLKELGIADRVEVVVVKKEFTALAAQQHGCDYMIRGIRSSNDFDAESLIQKANKEVIKGAKTLFVMPPRDLESVSSSFVKSLMVAPGWHWYVKEFVTKAVYDFLVKKYVTNCIKKYWDVLDVDWAKKEFTAKVLAAYESPTRFYHNIEHLAHGFQELEWAKENLDNSAFDFNIVGLAYCVHDFIYGQGSDEQKSADWFLEFTSKLGLFKEKQEIVQKVVDLVLSTAYSGGVPKNEELDKKLLRSIDLSILGQNSFIYNWYSSATRSEYAAIPHTAFYEGRLHVLKQLLGLDALYEIEEFGQKYEQTARKNIQAEIKGIDNLLAN